MTAEEILQNLHDLHVPPGAAGADDASFVFWPLWLVLTAAAAVIWLRYRRRTHWRRQALRQLAHIDSLTTVNHAQHGWTELATLMRQLALKHGSQAARAQATTSPVIERMTGATWLQQLDALTGSSIFTSGAGQGLLRYPYRPADNRSATQLKKLVAQLRNNRSWLRDGQPSRWSNGADG